MRWMTWVGLLIIVLLTAACFMPWVLITSRNIVVTGIDATGTSFGKPGYFHLLMAVIFTVFHFIPRIWAKRTNLAVAAINIAWALRNYFLITACRYGECPEKKVGIYLVLLSSALLMVAALMPAMPRVPARREK